MGSTILQYSATPVSGSGNATFALTTNGNTITLQDMTVQNGFNAASGGGVRVIGSGTVSTLNLTNLKITANKATKGGGVYIQGPVILNVTGCNITGNTATDVGPNTTGGGGIAINPQTTAAANVTIKNSTISNNVVAATAKNDGGGIIVQCGANASSAVNHTLWIENSTIYGNSTGYAGRNGGGIFFSTVATAQATAPTQTVTLNHCTIAKNTTNAGTGGDGVCVDNAGYYATTLVMNNSIVMDNSGSTSNQSQVGTNAVSQAKIANGGGINNNIFGILTGETWVTAATTHNNLTAAVSELAFVSSLSSGDATPVLLIGSGSIARDYVVSNLLSPALTTDQLNNSRSGVTDAGAYEYQPVNYTIGATAGANGSITSGTGIYENGTSATLLATPASGYGFLNWTESATIVSTDASYIFPVSANRTLVANFVTHSLISASSADANGIVSATSTYVNDGASFTLTATPNSGYSFLNWTEGGAEISTSAAYTFTVSAARTLVANFAPTATITLNGGTSYGTIALAIAASTSASDIINISAGVVTEKVTTLTKSLTIKGSGMGATIVQAAASPVSGSGVAFTLDAAYASTTTINIEDLTIRNSFNTFSAGGIRLNSTGATAPTLNLTNLKIYNNIGNNGGGVWVQGPATLNVTGCNITANSATNVATAAGGGGISVVAIGASAVNATIKNSTISYNTVASTSANNGGGISVQCGLNAGAVVDHKLWIENSTIYGNSTGYAGKVGAGICFKTTTAGQATTPTQTVTLNHCTIVGNTTNAGTGADGVCFDAAGGYPTSLVMNNSIVIGNSGSTSNQSQVGVNAALQTNVSNGGINSVITGIVADGVWATAETTHNNLTAALGDLAFAGSLSTDATPVLKIGSSSIARSYVTTNSLSPVLTTDQLGTTRLGYFDAGAWEFPIKRFTVTASTGTGGSITSGAGNYDSGATATVIAAANADYRFVNWTVSGSEVSTSISYPFTVSENRILVANFESVVVIVPTGTSIDASTLKNCTNCDVTISGANTVLTINETKTLNSVTATSGGKLVVSEPLRVSGAVVIEAGAKLDLSNTLTITGDLVLKSTETNLENTSFSANIGNGTLAVGAIKYLKTIDAAKWYFISFPSDVTIASITGSPALGTLGSNWFIKYYDGDKRGRTGTGENWIPFTAAMVTTDPTLKLKKYQGYIIGLESGSSEITFTLDKTVLSTESMRTIPVVANNAGAAISTTNHGWNLVGQPYLSQFVGSNLGVSNTTGATAYKIYISDGLSTYTPYTQTSVPNINPMSAYFIQASVGLAGSGISFDLGGRRQSAPAVVDTDLSDEVKLNFTSATGSDYTLLTMDNSYSTAYEIGYDLEKWIGTGTSKPQVYTMLGGINYAFNALPINSVNNLPLGIYTQSAGSTTISIDGTKATSLSKLLLIDNGVNPAIVTNLLTSNYTFTAAAGTNNTRFVITAQRIPTSNLVNADANENAPKLSIVNCQLSIENLSPNSTVRVYDAIGRMVAIKIVINNSLEIKLLAKGLYTIQIESGAKSCTKKVVI